MAPHATASPTNPALASVKAPRLAAGGPDAGGAVIGKNDVYMDGEKLPANIYDRGKLEAGNAIEGPAIVVEMDSTTVILAGHTGTVDEIGNIIIRPTGG